MKYKMSIDLLRTPMRDTMNSITHGSIRFDTTKIGAREYKYIHSMRNAVNIKCKYK
jgi:hypothetical protein